MKKRLSLFAILILFSISFCKAQVGDVCTNPFIASLCDSNTFSAYTPDFTNNVSTWNYNGSQINAVGQDIYYKIKLPPGSYQPTGIQASFSGYYSPTCTNCYEAVEFLWFTGSPCSSNPVAVNQVNIFGNSSLSDSIFVDFPITNVQSAYYLVIDFTNLVNYRYNLKLGFSNNQPYSQPICSVASAPFKGKLQLDSSVCYSSNNPYHLPLTFLEDNPTDSNTLIPSTLNQDLNYLPINDDNGNGFALTIKTTANLYPNAAGNDTITEIYQSFDQFPYTYSSTSSYVVNYSFDVAFTLFMKNSTGVMGLKGFRIQIPNGGGGTNPYGLPNGPGTYDAGGNWVVNFDPNSSTYTWLFNSNTGRGDDTGLNSYSCRVYTFDAMFNDISKGINAWYLPDNFGNDSLTCIPNPDSTRTDCSIAPTNYQLGWIPLFPAGSGGSGEGGLTGRPCGTGVYINLGAISLCDTAVPPGYSTLTIDENGCANEIDYYYDNQASDFDFHYPYEIGDNYVYICPGQKYNLLLEGNGNFDQFFTPSTLVFIDSINITHPVDSLGQILWNEDYYNLNIPGGLPAYPSSPGSIPGADSFFVPLSYPGHYTIIFSSYDNSSQTYSPACSFANLYLSYFPTIDSNFTWTVSGRVVTFEPFIFINSANVDTIYLRNQGIAYQWDFGDGQSSDNYNLIHTYSGTDTSYNVCFSIYIDYDSGINCPNTLCKTVDIGISGIANLLNQTNIQVYPNPFDDYLLIKAQDKPIKSIELYDVLGRKILSEEAGGNYVGNSVLRLNLSSLLDGMYYVKIKTDSAEYVQNVVKCK